MSVSKRIVTFFQERLLLLGIVFAIIIAFIMTIISLKLYDLDDVSRLDVSLPSHAGIRSSTKEDDTQQFGATGELNESTIANFQALFKKNRSELDALGGFDSNGLSDQSLQVGSNE